MLQPSLMPNGYGTVTLPHVSGQPGFVSDAEDAAASNISWSKKIEDISLSLGGGVDYLWML